MPPERVSSRGLLNTTLHVVPVHIVSSPLTYGARTYEGQPMGPTLRVRAGDTLVIHLVNQLGPETLASHGPANTLHSPNTTNLHLHGMHVSPAGIADNMFRSTAPGATSRSVYEIPRDHPSGLFYYHPHLHGSTHVQAMASMAGCLVVEDREESTPRELTAMREVILGLQQLRVEGTGLSSYVVAANTIRSLLPLRLRQMEDTPAALNHFTVNGQYQPILTVRPLEVVRWRLVNAGYGALLNLRLKGCQINVLAADGVLYTSPRPLPPDGALLVSAGSRRELAVMCPDPGTFPLTSIAPIGAAAHFVGPTNVWSGTVMTVKVAGKPRPMALPQRLPAPSFQDLRGPRAVSRFNFTWTQEARRLYSINGRPYTPGRERVVRLGAVEEWVIRTATEEGHPFHLHTNHFQIVDVSEESGFEFRVGDWRDTIACPVKGAVTIRFRPTDFTGRTLAHCHIFSHQDLGMVLPVDIIPA
jgi:FtsP/CotA-like multicopper oxidase with cupredoxin domain